MTRALSIIDADSSEFQCTTANHVRWKWPIEGTWQRKEPSRNERLLRRRPLRRIGYSEEVLVLRPKFGLRVQSYDAVESEIAAFLWRTDPSRGAFIVKETLESGNIRYIDLYRTGYEIDESNLTNRDHIVIITLECEAVDPVWYDPTPTTVTGQMNGATAVALSCANSNVETWLEVTLSGDANSPWLGNADGEYLQLSGNVGGILAIDFRPEVDTFGATYTASGGGTAETWTGRRTALSTWWRLPVGTTEVTVSGESGSNAAITLQFTKYYKVPY